MALFERGEKRIYPKGNLGAFLARTGRTFWKEVTKPGPKPQKSSGKISSEYITKKHPFMQLPRAKSILGGMGGPKQQKILVELRFENQTYDPSRKDDPHFSRREMGETVERTRRLYGETVARETKEALEKAFLGSQAITSKKAIQAISPLRKYGRGVSQGVGLVIQGFDKAFQSGRQAPYITGEKFENVVKQTEEQSGKYIAQILKKQFRATEVQDGAKPQTSSRIVGLQEGLLGWKRRSSGDSDNKLNNNK